MNAGQISRTEFIDFVRAAPLGVVATLDQLRGPEAALVGFAVTEDAELVFDSQADGERLPTSLPTHAWPSWWAASATFPFRWRVSPTC